MKNIKKDKKINLSYKLKVIFIKNFINLIKYK